MSQDELSVKIVVDDSQFRDDIARLRRDLEDQHRIDMDKLRADVGARPEEPRYAPGAALMQPTSIEVRGEPDEGMRQEIRKMQESIAELERRSGLPGQFGQLTINDLKQMFQEATMQPAWATSASESLTRRIEDVVDGLARRSYADVPMRELVGMDSGRYISGWSAALSLYDIILSSGKEERLSGAGLQTMVRELESGAGKGSVHTATDVLGAPPTRESIGHRVLKNLSYQFFQSAGKTAFYETYLKKEGLKRRFDLFTEFQGIKPVTREPTIGVQFPEIKSGRAVSGGIVTQVADQIYIALRYLNEKHGVTLQDIANNPEVLGTVAGVAARVSAGVISLEEHSEDDVRVFQNNVFTFYQQKNK